MSNFLYMKVYEELKQRINSSIYPPNSALPSETHIKKEFEVSQITVRRAIQELVLDGLVERRQGIGSFVRDTSQEKTVISLSGFTTDVASGRLRLVRTLLSDDMVPAAGEIADKLKVQPESLLRCLVRLDSIGGTPFSIDEAFILPSLAGKIDYEIASSPLFMHLLQKAEEMDFVQTEYDIRVEKANEYIHEHLRVDLNSPVLTTGELIINTSGRPVLWIVSKYPAYRCRLSGTVKLLQKETEYGTIGE